MSPQPVRRLFAALTTALLAIGLLPLAAAGSAAEPEVRDGSGDVNPLAVLIQVPAEAQLVEHAALYDLVKGYIVGEDEDGFYLRMEVADLPDDWILAAGTAGSAPIAPIELDELAVKWDDSWFNSKVNLTAHFVIDGKAYRAVATLAELNLENPNQFPAAYSDQLLKARFAAARDALEDAQTQFRGLPVLPALNIRAAIDSNLSKARSALDAANAAFNASDWHDNDEARGTMAINLDAALRASEAADDLLVANVASGTARDRLETTFEEFDDALLECEAILNTYANGLLVKRIEAARALISKQYGTVAPLIPPLIADLDARAEILARLAEARMELDGAHEALNESDAWGVPAAKHTEINAAIDAARSAVAAAAAVAVPKIPGALGGQVDSVFADLEAKLEECQEAALGLPRAAVAGEGDVEPAADPEAPRMLLFHRFTLIDAEGRAMRLDGVLDLAGDFVQIRIQKKDVGAPEAGDQLSKFRIDSSFRGHLMDFAPDAVNAAPTDAIDALLLQAATGKLVKPAFGKDYVFAYTEPIVPSPTGTSMAPVAGLLLQGVGPLEQTIEPGGVATYYVMLRNNGETALQGYFVLSSPADAWTHQLSASDWSLAPGSSTVLTLSVSGIGGGAERQVSRLTATASGIDPRSLDFVTTMDEGSDDPAKPPAQKRGTPGPEAGLLALGVFALAVALRRRSA